MKKICFCPAGSAGTGRTDIYVVGELHSLQAMQLLMSFKQLHVHPETASAVEESPTRFPPSITPGIPGYSTAHTRYLRLDVKPCKKVYMPVTN
jgi:hypothetical protein